MNGKEGPAAQLHLPGACWPQQHRHEEFTCFLNDVQRAVPAGKLIEAVMDNYATHRHPKVRGRLERHPRWTFRFTPTTASCWTASAASILARLDTLPVSSV